MSKTPEKKVKDQCVTQLKALGAYYFYPVTGGYGASGVPDIVVCYRGLFVGIECKAGRGVPTALQEKNLNDIRLAGGLPLVINENNVAHLTKWIVIAAQLHHEYQRDTIVHAMNDSGDYAPAWALPSGAKLEILL